MRYTSERRQRHQSCYKCSCIIRHSFFFVLGQMIYEKTLSCVADISPLQQHVQAAGVGRRADETILQNRQRKITVSICQRSLFISVMLRYIDINISSIYQIALYRPPQCRFFSIYCYAYIFLKSRLYIPESYPGNKEFRYDRS